MNLHFKFATVNIKYSVCSISSPTRQLMSCPSKLVSWKITKMSEFYIAPSELIHREFTIKFNIFLDGIHNVKSMVKELSTLPLSVADFFLTTVSDKVLDKTWWCMFTAQLLQRLMQVSPDFEANLGDRLSWKPIWAIK